jgi:hypothetical protein
MQKKEFFFIYILIVLIFFILFTELPMAAPRYGPDLNWCVLESPHFLVYFSIAQNNEQNNKDFSYSYEQLAQVVLPTG